MEWSDSHLDTLLVVTADHETGGMHILANNGAGNLPSVAWGTTGHTSAPVPVFALGIDAEPVPGILENTDIFLLLMNLSTGSGIRSSGAGIP